MTRQVIWLAPGLMMAGCVNLVPEHVRPDLSTNTLYDDEFRPDGSRTAATLSWQEFFADPRLRILIATALSQNRDLLAATARIEQARARYRIQETRRLPSITASGSAVRSRAPVQDRSGASSDASDDATEPFTGNSFDISVGVTSFELDFWGRVRNLSEAAQAEYLGTVAAQRAFYLSLIGDVASTYYEIVETDAQIALAEATVDSRQEGLRIARLRLESGVTSALDFRQAEALLTQAQQQLATQRLSTATLRNQLTVLVGGQLPADVPSGLPLAEQAGTTELAAGLPSDLLLTRPDIAAAEAQLRADAANIGAARAAFFPSISLTGTTGFASNELGNLFDGNSFSWSFGPSISIPLFDWGAREADLGLARALRLESVAAYDLTVQNAFREVSDALAGRRYLAEQTATVARAVLSQERIATLARLRYREGVTNYLEVLDAERSLFLEQQALLEVQRLELLSLTNLYIALGGGTQVPQEPVDLAPVRR